MFLNAAPETPEIKRYLESDLADTGFIMNLSRLWAWQLEFGNAFVAARMGLMKASTLSKREFAVLVCAAASTQRDSYCSLAWGARLAAAIDEQTAAAVLANEPAPALTAREAALAQWVRTSLRDPNATKQADVDLLREAGLDDKEIFEATAFAAMRVAFSFINDALGAQPDYELAESTPAAVRAAVDYGRPVEAAKEMA